MKNRLPLPLKTIQNIKEAIEKNSSNLWVRNPLVNALRDLCSYEYKDAINTLEFLQDDYPELLDYKKCISAIKSAEKRYKAI